MAKAKRKKIEYDEVIHRFAVRLREVRHARGMTQAQLAEDAGITVGYINRLENTSAAPGLDLLARLAKALGVAIADLAPLDSPPDTTAILKTQARRLLEIIVETDDDAALSLVVQFLARISETTERK